MDDLRELYDRWVTPLYMRLLHGNFRHMLLAEELSDERTQMISDFRRCVTEVDPAVVTTLIRQPDWRARLTGSWYAGLRGWSQFVDELGALLIESRACFAGQGYCAALASFAGTASAEYLRRYLDTWLPHVDKYYDQHWALPALVWVDKQLDTRSAAEYLVSGGLWDRWAAQHPHHRSVSYADEQRKFDLTLGSALAAFRAA